MCSSILIHVFDYGQKTLADQMRTTWKRLVHHVGTIHGHDISNKLLNKKTVIITKLDHTEYSYKISHIITYTPNHVLLSIDICKALVKDTIMGNLDKLGCAYIFLNFQYWNKYFI